MMSGFSKLSIKQKFLSLLSAFILCCGMLYIVGHDILLYKNFNAFSLESFVKNLSEEDNADSGEEESENENIKKIKKGFFEEPTFLHPVFLHSVSAALAHHSKEGLSFIHLDIVLPPPKA